MSSAESELTSDARTFGLHRGLRVLAAAVVLVVAARTTPITSHSIWADVFVLGSAFAVGLILVIAAILLPDRQLPRLDLVTIIIATGVQFAQYVGVNAGASAATDEAVLNRLALKTLLAGHNPYTAVYKLVGADGYGTPLLTGGQANTYQYPPLQLEIARVMHAIVPRFGSTDFISPVSFCVFGLVVFFALPTTWRPLASIAVLGLGVYVFAAESSDTILLSLALLTIAVRRWTETGAGGRLGTRGTVQAIFLGLAASAAQLSWFGAIFLITGILLIRLGELETRRAVLVTLRYLAISLAVFFVINAPFIFADASAWYHRLESTFTQPAVPFGLGWALTAMEARGGSSSLELFKYSAILLLAACYLAFITGFRRCGWAVMILPTTAFVMSSRSLPGYIMYFIPLWLVSIATADRMMLARAARVPLPRALTRRTWAEIAAVVVLVAPAFVVFVLGVTGDPPFRIKPLATSISSGRMLTLTVRMTNRTDRPQAPQYFVDQRTGFTHPWVPVKASQNVIPAGATETIKLHPKTLLTGASLTAQLWIAVTTSEPLGFAAGPLLIDPTRVQVLGISPTNKLSRERLRCLSLVFTNRRYDCQSQYGLSQVPGN